MNKYLQHLAVLMLAVGICASCADKSATKPAPQPPATLQEPRAATQTAEPRKNAATEQEATAEKLGLPLEITNSIGMKLILIPAGEFLMGSEESSQDAAIDTVTRNRLEAMKSKVLSEHLSRERPQHRVRLTKPYYLGIYEVTQEDYESLLKVNHSEFLGPRRPMETVSWDDAVKFCKKLSERPEEKEAGRAYRLPTEAEWEYACRAGTTTQYSCGDDHGLLVDYAWYRLPTSEGTHPVGEKRPNAWGLYDMHGNVFEWCADWFASDYYKDSPEDDPQGPTTGSDRVVRGGCWMFAAHVCRSASRAVSQQGTRMHTLGFRVALDAFPTAAPPANAGPPDEAPQLTVREAQTTVEHLAPPQREMSPIQQAAALELGWSPEINNSIGMTLVLIPAGEFMMGSREIPEDPVGKQANSQTQPNRFADEQPQHRVRITKPYYMSIYEVTQDQYERVMETNPGSSTGPADPVTNVRWNDAKEFCDRLSARHEEESAHRVYRLPTEAEWEYACRAGSTTLYSFGDDPAELPNYAWIGMHSEYRVHPVGGKRPNAWSLYDMHGNVWEWCADWYSDSYYGDSPLDDPAGPASGSQRVVRSSCRLLPAPRFRSAERSGAKQMHRDGSQGFRVALDLVTPP